MIDRSSIEALMGRGRWLEAQAVCREAIFARPGDAKLHAYEGICLFRLNDFAAAEACFMRATALDPTFVEAGVKRCQCLERLWRYEEAVTLAKEWQRQKPSHPVLAHLVYQYGFRRTAGRREAWEENLRPNRAVEFAA